MRILRSRLITAERAISAMRQLKAEGDNKCVEILQLFKDSPLTRGEAKKAMDGNHFTLLHYVMFYGKGEGVLELVQYLYDLIPGCVRATSLRGNLAIHLVPDWLGNRVLCDKMQRDQLAARLFIIRKCPALLSTADGDGNFPLCRAISGACYITAKVMIESFPHVAKQINANGENPLHLCLKTPLCNTSLVEALIFHFPKGLHQLDNAGKSPFDYFLNMGRPETLGWRKQILSKVAKAAPRASILKLKVSHQEEFFNELASVRRKVSAVSPEGNGSEKDQGNDSDPNLSSLKGTIAASRATIGDLTKKAKDLAEERGQLQRSQSEIAKLNEKVKEVSGQREELRKKLEETQSENAARAKQLKAQELSSTQRLSKLEKEIEERDAAKSQAVAFIEEQNLFMRLLTASRKSEARLLSKIECTWSVPDLKPIVQSLVHRINDVAESLGSTSERSIAVKFAERSFNDPEPSQKDMVQLIKALNKELLELESNVERRSRKRARPTSSGGDDGDCIDRA